MVTAWGFSAPLEIVRFAAANHLCVDLAYHGSRRLIEPYILRRTRDGNIVLHATRHDSGEHRSYRADRIEGASATSVSFVPRYAIELTTSGPLSIPSTTSAPRPTTPRSRSSVRHTGPTYVIQCMTCGKRFNRTSYDTRLNRHKDKSGFDCFGRTGFLADTKYRMSHGLPTRVAKRRLGA
jgi:hypothetical protein